MEHGHAWWFTIEDKLRCCINLSCWNPIDKFEFRRSLEVKRFYNIEIPFISVVLAIWFIKFEWYLYLLK